MPDPRRLAYAFGHLVASHTPDDPHHADSGDLADEELDALGLSLREKDLVEAIAEHVAGNYTYTGEAELALREMEGKRWATS